MGWVVCNTCNGYGRVKGFLWLKKKCPDCFGDGGLVSIDAPKPAPEPKKEAPVQSFRNDPTMANYRPPAQKAQSLPTRNPYYGQNGGSNANQSQSRSSTSSYRPSHYSTGVTSGNSHTTERNVEHETVYVDNTTFYPVETTHHHHHHCNDSDDDTRRHSNDSSSDNGGGYDSGSSDSGRCDNDD